MSKKLAKDAIEYQPDAIEIKHERLSPWARFGVWGIFLLLAIAVAWSYWGQVDVVVTANGKLVTTQPPVVMKPLERAVIKEVNVEVGEVVKKDQVLITFDTAINEAETERLKSELSTLNAQFERLFSEFEDTPYTPGADAGKDGEWQLAIYRQRHEFYEEKIKYYDQNVKQVEASYKSNEDSLRKQQERLVAIQEIEGMYTGLLEKKALPLKDLLELSISRMQMESDVDKLRNALVELEHQKQSVIANRNSYIEEWRNTISEEMVKVQRELIKTRKDYDKMEQMNSYVYLRSPGEAVVHEIAAFSTGSAVREAEALITLIPLGTKIELEAEVSPQDIGKVQLGAEARIKLNAFPFQKHGTLDGKVRNISEDTLQKSTNQPGVDPSYYRAKLVVAGNLDNVKDNFRLIPGMECQVEIKVGRRRIIEFVIYPLIKALDETAREP